MDLNTLPLAVRGIVKWRVAIPLLNAPWCLITLALTDASQMSFPVVSRAPSFRVTVKLTVTFLPATSLAGAVVALAITGPKIAVVVVPGVEAGTVSMAVDVPSWDDASMVATAVSPPWTGFGGRGGVPPGKTTSGAPALGAAAGGSGCERSCPSGVTGFEGVEGVPVPNALVAVTVTV